MPRSDLESPSNNGDGAVETLAAAAAAEEEEEEEDPEMPPESFRIGIGEEFDWAELNAVLDREDSTRGSANPKSQQQQQQLHHHHHHHHHHHANPSKPRSDDSQRFSGIIVLPGAIPISGAYLGRSARRARRKKMAGNGGGNGGSAVPETDPGSPKVSCSGKVMSQRDRRRNSGILRRSPDDDDDEGEEERGGRRRRGSFLAAALRRFCGSGGGGGGASAPENIPAMVAAPPGLGGTRRFVSGRRGDYSYGGDADGGMFCHVALSRALDREIVAGIASVGPFEETGRDRD